MRFLIVLITLIISNSFYAQISDEEPDRYSAMPGSNRPEHSFEKGKFYFDLQMAFGGFYGQELSATTNNCNFNTLTINNIENKKKELTEGMLIIPLLVEYSLSSKMGVGVEYKHFGFLNSSTTHGSGQDFGGRFSYHFINYDYQDLYVALGVGVSNLKSIPASELRAPVYTNLSGTGYYLKVNFGYRVFILKDVAISTSINYAYSSYSNMKGTYTQFGRDAETNAFEFDKSASIQAQSFYIAFVGLSFKL